MVGALRQAAGPLFESASVWPFSLRGKGHQLGLAQGDRAGLVEGQHLDLASLLDVKAAFDDDAATGGSGQAAHHRDWGGDHQRAGAGDHQQHQGLVDRLEWGEHQQGWRQQGNGQGHHEHRRGVAGRKAIHEPLDWGAGGLGFLHGLDDARQGAERGGRRHLNLEGSALVDRARKHRIAWAFIDRQAFAGDRGLIDRAHAGKHSAIKRQSLARTDPHHISDGSSTGGQALPAAVALADLRLIGGQRHQAGDRLAGPLHRPRFDRLCHGIERHHHGGFWEAADQEGARDRHAHQRIDVEPALAQCREALSKHGEARQGDRGDGDPDLQQLMPRVGGNDQMQQLRRERQCQGARQA